MIELDHEGLTVVANQMLNFSGALIFTNKNSNTTIGIPITSDVFPSMRGNKPGLKTTGSKKLCEVSLLCRQHAVLLNHRNGRLVKQHPTSESPCVCSTASIEHASLEARAGFVWPRVWFHIAVINHVMNLLTVLRRGDSPPPTGADGGLKMLQLGSTKPPVSF